VKAIKLAGFQLKMSMAFVQAGHLGSLHPAACELETQLTARFAGAQLGAGRWAKTSRRRTG
jgi:hypothetical protein